MKEAFTVVCWVYSPEEYHHFEEALTKVIEVPPACIFVTPQGGAGSPVRVEVLYRCKPDLVQVLRLRTEMNLNATF